MLSRRQGRGSLICPDDSCQPVQDGPGAGAGAGGLVISHPAFLCPPSLPPSTVVAMLGMLSPSSRGALMTTACFLFMFMG